MTVDERIKADKFIESQKGPLLKKSNGEKKKKLVLVSGVFSQGEKDLYKEVNNIKKRKEQEAIQKRKVLKLFYISMNPI